MIDIFRKKDYGDVKLPEKVEKNYLDYMDEDEDIIKPSEWGPSLFKYQVEAEVPTTQRKDLNRMRPFYGRHVAMGNTLREDNLKHLDAYDSSLILEDCPTLRHLATRLKGREVSEYQMCRGNPEIGGFERKMQSTGIKRQDIDVNEHNYPSKSKGGIFGFLSKKKKVEEVL